MTDEERLREFILALREHMLANGYLFRAGNAHGIVGIDWFVGPDGHDIVVPGLRASVEDAVYWAHNCLGALMLGFSRRTDLAVLGAVLARASNNEERALRARLEKAEAVVAAVRAYDSARIAFVEADHALEAMCPRWQETFPLPDCTRPLYEAYEAADDAHADRWSELKAALAQCDAGPDAPAPNKPTPVDWLAVEPLNARPWVNGCHSDDDGHCTWEGCPQLRDGEPKKSGRSCPLWDRREECDAGREGE